MLFLKSKIISETKNNSQNVLEEVLKEAIIATEPARQYMNTIQNNSRFTLQPNPQNNSQLRNRKRHIY